MIKIIQMLGYFLRENLRIWWNISLGVTRKHLKSVDYLLFSLVKFRGLVLAIPLVRKGVETWNHLIVVRQWRACRWRNHLRRWSKRMIACCWRNIPGEGVRGWSLFTIRLEITQGKNFLLSPTVIWCGTLGFRNKVFPGGTWCSFPTAPCPHR